MLGGLVGSGVLVVWGMIGAVVAPTTLAYRWRRAAKSGSDLATELGRTAIDVAVMMSLAGILTLTVLPLGFDLGGVNLVPFRSIVDMATTSVNAEVAIRNLAGNVALFAPLGFFGALRYIGRRPILVAGSIGAVMSATIEIAQFFLGRSADIDDVILNTVGGLLGAVLAVVAARAVAAARGITRRRAVPMRGRG